MPIADVSDARSTSPIDPTRTSYRGAASIDPDFAQAHALLAIALLGRYWFDTNPQTLQEASRAAQRALELDSSDPTVHQAQGWSWCGSTNMSEPAFISIAP
jgi:hypothetical protein